MINLAESITHLANLCLSLFQWLHLALVDHLPTEYLAAYLDVLQTLRGKIPSLVEKMIAGKVRKTKIINNN